VNKLIDKLKALWQRVVQSRIVRLSRMLVHSVSLPGNKGVPVYDVAQYLFRGIFNGDLWRASKGLAFSFLMALPPLLIFVFTLIAFLPVDGLQNELLYELEIIVPEKIYQPLANTINDVMGHKHTSLLSIGFATSVILAANAINGMMMYFADRHIERRTIVISYAICLLLVFLLYIMLVLVLVLLIGYKTILMWLFRQGILVPGSFTHIIISIGRWIILVGMALLTLSVIYYLIPTKKQRVGFFSAGAVFATLMFILVS
jgi:membrane protein